MSELGRRTEVLSAIGLCILMITSLVVLLPSRSAAPPNDGWIEGTVSDGTNPVPSALVIYILNTMGGGYPLGSAWTNSSGYYNLTVTGGLSYMVIVFQGDFYSASGMTSVTVGEASTVDVVMTPIAPKVADVTLHGFVTDEFGNPVTVGDMIGYSNDPNASGNGAPYYGNATAPNVLGQYSVNVLASTQGGGVAIMNVPGHQFAENSSKTAFVSGESYWLNISFKAQVSTDDAVVSGTVTEAGTGLPIDNALVSIESWNQWNENESGYSNFTLTDASGHYEMNVTNGTANVMFTKAGYSMCRYENIQINHHDSLVLDAQLYATTATVRGNVTDADTGLPIASAQVYETDMMGNFTMAYTDSSGHYVLDAFAGNGVVLVAQANGYGQSFVSMNISVGDNIWYDFLMYGANSWLTGTVTDVITGMPIENASVNVYKSDYSAWGQTDASGVYNLTNLINGTYSININAMNYMSVNDIVDVLSGGNVYDAQMVPWNIPQTCKLWGYVTDDLTSAPIVGAKVEIGQGAPEYSNYNSTNTGLSGYYEMWVPPIPLVYVVSANNYMHVEGTVNASKMTSVQLDASLVPDLWSPNITFDQSPLENISWTNPARYQITIQEKDPSMFALGQFLYFNSTSGWDYYYLVDMLYDSFNPLQMTANNLPYSLSGDEYTVDYWWSASASGGWLQNSTDSLYLSSYMQMMGPTPYYAFRGYYTNSSLSMWLQGTAWFDSATGDYAMFSFDGPNPPVGASDATGRIAPAVNEMQVNPDTYQMNWMSNVMMGDWSVVGLKFESDATVPSGNWLSVFSAGDFAGHGNGTVRFFTVDNDPPIADAGLNQTVVENTAASFDGSGSSDNVGIVNYTWSFTDNGVPIEVYGVIASYNFTEVGSHEVTLTVTDGAGHLDSATTWVEVVADQPPFADAGLDQTVMVGDLVQFNGSGSYDDVNIVNWTWTFIYDGSTVMLYGPNPTFIFLIEGTYNVTLTVNDTAGQTSTDMVQITVSSMIPEFPTLLLPVIGMAAIVMVARLRKRR
jgi:hypothetical protein